MSDEAYYSIKLGVYIIACFLNFLCFVSAIKAKNQDAISGWLVAFMMTVASWRG